MRALRVRKTRNNLVKGLLIVSLFLGSMLGIFTPQAVQADQHYGFDNFNSNQVGYAGSPASGFSGHMMTYADSNSTCWSGSTFAPDTGVESLPTTQFPEAQASASPPHVFMWTYDNTHPHGPTHCDPTALQWANLTIRYIAAMVSPIYVSWFQEMINVTTNGTPSPATHNNLYRNSVVFHVSFSAGGTNRYTNDTSTIYPCNRCWNEIVGVSSPPVYPNNERFITFSIGVVPPVSHPNVKFVFAIDTVVFTNSNLDLSAFSGVTGTNGPCCNFQLLDPTRQTLFNLSSFINQPPYPTPSTIVASTDRIAVNYSSSVIVDNICYNATAPYTNQFFTGWIVSPALPNPSIQEQFPVNNLVTAHQCIATNVEGPIMYIPFLNQSNLITISSTSPFGYTWTEIPCLDPLNGWTSFSLTGTRHCGMADSPWTGYIQSRFDGAALNSYTLQIEDVANTFSAVGTKVFIYRSNLLLTSGYLDVQSQFPAVLSAGTYVLELISPTGSIYKTTFTAGSNPTITVGIGGQSFTASSNIANVLIGAGLTCDSTGIIAAYQDKDGLTTLVTFTLEKEDVAGLHFVAAQTLAMGLGITTLQTTFTGINQSISVQYLIQENSTRTTGEYPILGPYPITSQVSGCNQLPNAFPKQPTFPPNVLGLNEILPTPAAWAEMLSLFILFMTAALFGARSASLGSIFVVAEAIIFTAAGWIPLQAAYADIFILASIITFLAMKSRRKYT